MYKLYYSTWASSLAVQASLEHVGANHQLQYIDLSKGEHRIDDYLSLNPAGKVPTLSLPDGQSIGEAAAAITLLGEAFPEEQLTPLYPHSDRAGFLFWLNVLATAGGSAGARCGHPYRFAASDAAQVEVLEKARRDFDEIFGLLDNAISGSPFFLPGGVTGFDYYLAMYCEWHFDREALFAANKRLATLYAAVSETKAYRTALASHRAAPE